MHTVGIGVAGAGTVGISLINRLIADREAIAARTGLDLEVRGVAVRDLGRRRPLTLPAGVLTGSVDDLVDDDRIDLIVEVMGGLDPAGRLVLGALGAGKPVVTANKELVALRGPELLDAAASAGVPLLFEAAVGGGIPIIRPLMETLAGERIDRVMGIVNGTTNYIVTRLTEGSGSYRSALAEAQRLGYAEADPTADISGADAASKVVILAGLAFGVWVETGTVHREGIEGLTEDDFAAAARLGHVIRLLAIAERRPDGIVTRVHPAMLPATHPLASIRGATNAVFVEGASVGELLFAGPGAGGMPTATAVLGDVIDAARGVAAGAPVAPPMRLEVAGPGSFDDTPTQWCLRLDVEDSPGVLASIAGVFGAAGVSIKSVRQDGRGDRASLLMLTHSAPEGAQRRAHEALRSLDAVREVASVIRVEGDES
ncbi:MAG TPA: homoserine dehydrogenase [Acidimicrobiia bacterium]|nr:homoserine dehydrogenase [Acidimicrobiia bacterium]